MAEDARAETLPRPAPQKTRPRANTYLRVSCGKLKSPGPLAEKDGLKLVQDCLHPLEGDRKIFPPKLFILWVTPAFCPQIQPLLQGAQEALVRYRCHTVPLVGASVAVCVFDGAAHEQGAVLTCLASRFLQAFAAVCPGAQADPAGAVSRLFQDLGIRTGQEFNPRRNRFLLTFLPGYPADGDPAGYRAAELVEELNRQTEGALPMFGGVASAGLERGSGLQIFDGRAYTQALVAAAVSSDLCFGLGLSQGLTPTGHTYHVKDVAPGGRVIRAFWEEPWTASDVFSDIDEPQIFGQARRSGERDIVVPYRFENRVTVQRPVTRDAVLEVLWPDENKLETHLEDLKRWMLDNFSIPEGRVVAGLGITCASRYRDKDKIGWDVPGALRRLRQRYPGAEYVGCFMDGEVGIDSLGRTCFSNWSVSELLLADDLPPASLQALVFRALRRQGRWACTANSVLQAMDYVLKAVAAAGASGGMVSLLLRNGDTECVVAQRALGERWQEKVLPLTQRQLDSNDVLAVVARTQQPMYVQDAQTHPNSDHQTAIAGDVDSFYALPLVDMKSPAAAERPQTLGVLQIDLGDRRDVQALSPQQTDALSALGQVAAIALSRAVQNEELQLSRRLDDVLARCRQECRTVDEAASRFVQEAAAVMGASAHVWLAVPGTRRLRLTSGVGPYYEAAKDSDRRDIDVMGDTPSAVVFRRNKECVWNDALKERLFIALNERLGGTAVGEAHRAIRACAIFPIAQPGERPLGAFSFHAPAPWFFTPSRVRSLQTVGARLSLLLAHIRQRQARQQALAFLRDIAPPVEGDYNVYSALRAQAERARAAARADVISYYLWDEERGRLVLRAEAGWRQPGWVDAAWFTLGEGLVGMMAQQGDARHIKDVSRSEEFGVGADDKYFEEMFGPSSGMGSTWEALALPLRKDGAPLGVVVLYRKREQHSEGTESGFATVDPQVLQEACGILTTTVLALQRNDLLRWKAVEVERLDAISRVLLQQEHQPQQGLIEAFCQEVRQQYKIEACAVYLKDPERDLLHRKGLAQRAASATTVPEGVGSADCLMWEAFALGRPTLEVRPPTPAQRVPAQVRLDLIPERACVPIDVDGRVVGVLELRWRGLRRLPERGPPPRFGLDNLVELAKRLALAIELHRLHSEHEKARDATERAQRALDGIAQSLRKHFHQLARGVQGIGSGLSLLRRRQPTAEQKDIIEEVQGLADELVRLLARVREAGSSLAEMKRGWCRLDKLLQEALRGFVSAIENTGINVCYGLVEEVEAYVDGMQVLECFEILIDNAIKAMPRGGKLLLSLHARGPDPGICQAVIADTGIGMDSEHVDHIRRGEPLPGRANRAGIGLFLARLFCESHNGRLDLRSEPGIGTTVTVLIPLNGSSDRANPSSNRPELPMRHPSVLADEQRSSGGGGS
jgi:signal transduction histidine kinase